LIKFLFFIFFTIFLSSSSFEDYLKQEQKDFNQYTTALDEEWKSFKSLIQNSPYQVKKPKRLPKIKEVKTKNNISQRAKKVKLSKIKKDITKKIKISQNIIGNSVSLSFLNQKIKIPFDKKISKKLGGLSNSSISTYYNNMTSYKYQKTISFIKQYKYSSIRH